MFIYEYIKNVINLFNKVYLNANKFYYNYHMHINLRPPNLSELGSEASIVPCRGLNDTRYKIPHRLLLLHNKSQVNLE